MHQHASVNRIYRLVWNEITGAWIAVAETSRRRGKRSSRRLAALLLSLGAAAAHAGGPTGGQVTAGSGSIAQSGNTTTINQSSQTLSLSWQTFNIAPQQTVDFVQPNSTSVAINRILATDGSVILGHLNANGQIYLINPNGILFGQGAQVNVGSLVASTLDLDPNSTGNTKSFSGTGSGSVINQGSITAATGGTVALLGNHVGNTGVISAQLGSVALGAGSAVTLTFNGDRLVSMQVNQSVLNSEASNGGLIRADGGTVLMTAGAQKAFLASLVNNTGVIEARTLENHEGTITLLGGMSAGTVNVAGTLDASAPTGGNGGAIETSAAHVQIADSAKVTTAAAMGLNGTWLIDPTDFTIAATGGDETGAQLSSALGGGNVTIQSNSGTTGTAGDINVNDTVAWSANTLTLSAQNDININAPMNGSGTAVLALKYGQGAISAGNSSSYNIGAQVNLSAGPNFSTQLGSDGPVTQFTVITILGTAADATTAPGTATLQGTAASSNLLGNFALGNNIDASGTSSWNAGAGFTPIGSASNSFNGEFEGLGHIITGLTINLPPDTDVGLFGDLGSASIQNLGLSAGSVAGATRVGFLAGSSNGIIANCFATGVVLGTGNSSSSVDIGGLVGINYGLITNSHATGSVTGPGEKAVGGLVGENYSSISNSYATGAVSATSNYVGGLAGTNTGTISLSYSTGSVMGSSYVGGLVGTSQDIIDSSYATGNVTATGRYVGGLVGLVNNGGQTPAPVSNSYATGLVSGVLDVGGLIGNNFGATISNSYATGNVTGTSELGGLVGYNSGILSNSFYDVDQVTVNGAHWLTAGGIYNAQYLDWFSHGESLVIGNYSGTLPMGSGGYYNVSSVQGLDDLLGFAESNAADNFRLGANLSLPSGFSFPYFAGSFDGNGYSLSNLSLNFPNSNLGMFGYLPASLTAISNVALTNANVTGNSQVGALVGFNTAGGSISNSYAVGTVTGSSYVGGLVGNNTGPVSTSYFSGAVASSNGYNVGGLVGTNSGTISNSYASATVTGSSSVGGLVGANYGTVSNSYASGKVTGGSYVGGLAGLAYGTITDSFYSKSANPGLTGGNTYSGPIADVAGVVWGLASSDFKTSDNFTSPTIANGNVNPNWDIDTAASSGSVWFMYEGETAPLLRVFMTPLTVSGVITQTYDAIAFAPSLGALSYSIAPDPTQLLGSLTVTGNAQGALNAGTYTFTPGGLYSDQLGYLISYNAGSLTINRAQLTVSGTMIGSKVYNGTTLAGLTGGSLVGLIGDDTVTLTQAGSFASKNVGTGIAVSASDGISGASAGDYTLVEPIGLTGTITPASLTVSGSSVGSKVYNGTTSAPVMGGTLVGIVGGDTVTLNQSGTFASANPGTGIAVSATDSLGGADAGDYSINEPTGLSGSITPTGGGSGAAGASGASGAMVLAALNARAQIEANFTYPQLGATAQVVSAAPTMQPVAAWAESSIANATSAAQAVGINVSMKIGATGTLTIENGGLRLPTNLVIGNE